MSRWPTVPLREVLRQVSDPHPVSGEQEYPNLGIYSYARGLFPKPAISGTTTSAKSLFRVHAGQFIYSRLFAFEGAYGGVAKKYDGYFVSNEYPTFDCDPIRLDLQYLLWYFRRPQTWVEVASLASGMGHRRQRVQPEQFLSHGIPLPPLSDQQRVVEWIDALAAKIDEAKGLRAAADDGINALCRSVLQCDSGGTITPTPMRELVVQREPDVEVVRERTYHFAGVYCFGRGVFRGQRKTGMEFQYPRLTRLRTDDFVYPKLMAWEGALATVPAECDGLVVSTEFPVFEVNKVKVLPEVLDVHFRTPEVWPALSGTSTGTNVRRRRLNPADFLRYKFPLPTMATQERVKAIREKASSTSGLRATQQRELDAMLPAILDRAFRGEL